MESKEYRQKKEELLNQPFGNPNQAYLQRFYDGVSNISFIDRYFKIADLFPHRVINKGKERENLVVLDLGSSVGIAALGFKELLRVKGYETYIIGIDPLKENFIPGGIGQVVLTKKYRA